MPLLPVDYLHHLVVVGWVVVVVSSVAVVDPARSMSADMRGSESGTDHTF